METMETPIDQTEAPPDVVANNGAVIHAHSKPPEKQAKKPRASTPRNVEAHVESIEGEGRIAQAVELRDYLEQWNSDGELKINILRKAPTVGANGERIGGSLETVEDKIDEDYIREMWGGGKFTVTINAGRANGQFKMVRRFQLEIAGPPKMHGQLVGMSNVPVAAIAAGPTEDNGLAKMAFTAMHERETAAQQQLRSMMENSQKGGLDAATLAAITQPFMATIAEAQATIRDLQVQLVAAANKPVPRDEARDDLFKQMLTGDRSEAQKLREHYDRRIEVINERHEATVDKMRERYEDKIEKLEDEHRKAIQRMDERHKDEIKSIEKRHDRELDQHTKLNEIANKSTEKAVELQTSVYREQLSRLEADRAEKASTIGTLQAKKDQTLFDKMEEVSKARELLEEMGGGGGSDAKWYEKLFDVIGNSEAALRVIDKIGGGPQQQAEQQQIVQQQQQQQLPPAHVPFRHTDGKVYAHDGAGNFYEVTQNPKKKKKKKHAQQQAQAVAPAAGDAANANAPAAADGTPAEDEDEVDDLVEQVQAMVDPPDEKDLKRAIEFMENAVKGKDPNPEGFARGAQSLVPADVLAWVLSFDDGDHLLKNIKLPPSSPLLSIKGRQFIRSVHSYLKNGGG